MGHERKKPQTAKSENEMTKDEIINGICDRLNLATNGSHNENLRAALEQVFGAGWRSGERYANGIAKIDRKELEKRIRGYYGDVQCKKCRSWHNQDDECGACE